MQRMEARVQKKKEKEGKQAVKSNVRMVLVNPKEKINLQSIVHHVELVMIDFAMTTAEGAGSSASNQVA